MDLEYLKILEKYNVKYLYHFSNLANLNSILTHGILNREYMDENGIKYYYSDKDRNDEQLDCISLSLNDSNRSMSFSKKNNNNSEWFVIEIDAKLLIKDYYNNIYFCKYNAAALNTIKMLKENKNFLKSAKAFENVFDDKKIISNQAELLVQGNIGLKYINKIYVENLQNKLLVEQLLISNNSSINVLIKKGMF